MPDLDLEVARASLRSARASVKPRGRAFSGVSNMGNGDWCPVEGHGRKYVLDGGRQWCPHQSHDAELLDRHETMSTVPSLVTIDLSAMEGI